MHAPVSGSSPYNPVHKIINPYSDEGRHIYFMSDVPHLLKTTRNNWSHSFSHGNTRNLWVYIRLAIYTCMSLCLIMLVLMQINDIHISWKHLVQLYEAKMALGHRSNGLSHCSPQMYLNEFKKKKPHLRPY